MRHRLINGTGIGNPDKVILDNKGRINNKFALFLLKTYFQKEGGFDFSVTKTGVTVGIEPSYQYEKLKIIHINKNKKMSYIKYGKAFGPYGSNILPRREKYFKDFKLNSKFVRLVNEFHPILFKKAVKRIKK